MSRRHHSVPSQRIPLSVSTLPTSKSARARNSGKGRTESKSPRGMWWLPLFALAGWAILYYPGQLLVLLSYILLKSNTGEDSSASTAIVGILGMFLALCMIAAPVFAGLAMWKRSKFWWILAAVSGALTVIVVVYVFVDWIIPLG